MARHAAPARAATPSEARRRDERDARRARILDGALAIAVESGLSAVTTTRLSASLGYTVGALYRYFPSIEALLAALHHRTAELFYDAYFAALAPARASLDALASRKSVRVRALARVALLVLLYRRLAEAHPERFALVGQLLTQRWTWIDAAEQRSLDALVLPRIAEIVSIVAAASEVPRKRPANAVQRTMTLWLGAHAALAIAPLAERHPGLLDPGALFDETLRTQLRGWGANGPDVEAAIALAEAALARSPGAHHPAGPSHVRT